MTQETNLWGPRLSLSFVITSSQAVTEPGGGCESGSFGLLAAHCTCCLPPAPSPGLNRELSLRGWGGSAYPVPGVTRWPCASWHLTGTHPLLGHLRGSMHRGGGDSKDQRAERPCAGPRSRTAPSHRAPLGNARAQVKFRHFSAVMAGVTVRTRPPARPRDHGARPERRPARCHPSLSIPAATIALQLSPPRSPGTSGSQSWSPDPLLSKVLRLAAGGARLKQRVRTAPGRCGAGGGSSSSPQSHSLAQPGLSQRSVSPPASSSECERRCCRKD